MKRPGRFATRFRARGAVSATPWPWGLFGAPALAPTVLALTTLATSAAPAVAREAPVAWVQMTGAGAEVRLATAAEACPVAVVDGRPRPMATRAGPAPGFPTRVCAAGLRPGDRRVTVAGASLAAPARRVDRVVVLGDSGCRLKGHAYQHCNDPSGWPFGRIAALAAARKPDLVIHVGDYYYREQPCPGGAAGCAGSPWGDSWPTWKAELFDPAAPLLAAAPWVFARGNHESCGRGATGWFRLLDAAPAGKACAADAGTFTVDLGGPRLIVADSNDSDDLLASGEGVAAFAARLAPAAHGGRTWIVTHRPVWTSARLGDLVIDGIIDRTERLAVRRVDLAGVDLVLSGHVHNFTSLGFGRRRPAQLIVGAAGDNLDMNDSPPPASGTAIVDGLPADIFTMGRWGYLLLERRGREWAGEFRDTQDRVAAVCRLRGRDLACREPRAGGP